jgi:site-specific recombinase XerD
MITPTLGTLLYGFFEEHLKVQKGVSPATVKSYRDALRLFLRFIARDRRNKITRIQIEDLTAEQVRRFLASLETERHNHVRSRNQRLAALKAFFEYLAIELPERLDVAERVMALPVKRAPPPPTLFLDRDDVQDVFAHLPASGPYALRDRALLLFLYNTGARVQEVAELRRRHLEFDRHRVHLHGKGDKWRTCPLWQESVSLLRQLLDEPPQAPLERPVFTSQRGQALTRFGIYKIVRRHTAALGKRGSDGELKLISPHVWRHTAAVHLLEAGVEVNVIRAWLGHVSLETTNRYAEINLALKEAALQACAPPTESSAEPHGKPIWRDDPSLLKWLQSL